MQRTIRILRVALPLVFIAFIAVIAVNWRRGKPHKDKGGTVPVTSTIRPTDTAAIESKTFEDTQTVNGRVASRIRAQRVVASLPDTQLELLPGIGHCPQIEAADRVAELLLEFPATLRRAA